MVAETICGLAGIREAVVYGVEVPGPGGRVPVVRRKRLVVVVLGGKLGAAPLPVPVL